MKISTVVMAALLFAVSTIPARVHAQAPYRSLQVEITEVTEPDLTAAADGRAVIFSALGHLHRVPVTGGVTEQLTFGPSYDSDPAISPDGRRVAFVSNRDGS